VGVTIFLAAEVAYPLVRYIKRRRREGNALRQELDEAAELIELDKTDRTGEGDRDITPQRIVRMASGFEAAENGRASVRNLR
jgi:hypothetical protein